MWVIGDVYIQVYSILPTFTLIKEHKQPIQNLLYVAEFGQ